MLKRSLPDDNDESSDVEHQPPPKKDRKVNTPGSSKASQSLKITDMPVEILLLVFSKINIWEQNHIRGTCEYFRAVHDLYLRHKIPRAISKFNENKFEGDRFAAKALIAVKRGTQVYVNAGYESIMYDCLMPLLCCAYRTPFDIRDKNIKGFLTNFYDTVDANMENPHSNHARMLYMMTMIDILRSFSKCNLNTRNQRRSLFINFHLHHKRTSQLPKGFVHNPEKSNAFLTLLTLLLVSNLSEMPIIYINESYCVATPESLTTETDLHISIVGSERIRSFFEKWAIDRSDDEFQLLDNLNDENFHFDMNIASTSATIEMFHIEPMFASA